MIDPSPAVLPGLMAALRASAALKAAMGVVRIYDIVPAKAKFPYLTVGQADHVLPDDGEGIDAADYHLTIHAWSRPAPVLSTAECRAIVAAVVAVVGRPQADPAWSPPALSGFAIQEAEIETVEILIDPSDGQTAHGVVGAVWTIEPV